MEFRISGRSPSSSHTPRLEKNGKTPEIGIADAKYNAFCDSLRNGHRSCILSGPYQREEDSTKHETAHIRHITHHRMRLCIPITNSHLPSHREILRLAYSRNGKHRKPNSSTPKNELIVHFYTCHINMLKNGFNIREYSCTGRGRTY
jgi:hypothetical protein